MKVYLLVGETSHEESELLLVAETIEAAKAGALEVIPNEDFYADCLSIYEAEVGGKPQGILTALHERRYNGHGAAPRYTNRLGEWLPW
ncbi:hypothetical protein ACFFGR_09265 [Arthrobacter liuii]|uniref:Uncharacterized protein n=1 Tax=Arthrobacter liuii TaxID=1476996 RepID=A0ABQ2APZ6_9MICC|nr:hypothetical protein [Arthrobacter liuii]GGH93802.1 hypothetical protein GCM10007170_15520 [Arthrobacter liuii]